MYRTRTNGRSTLRTRPRPPPLTDRLVIAVPRGCHSVARPRQSASSASVSSTRPDLPAGRLRHASLSRRSSRDRRARPREPRTHLPAQTTPGLRGDKVKPVHVSAQGGRDMARDLAARAGACRLSSRQATPCVNQIGRPFWTSHPESWRVHMSAIPRSARQVDGVPRSARGFRPAASARQP